MEPEDFGADPFSSDGLWRLSKFSTLALKPLESLPWNDELPDLTGGFFKSPLNIFDGDDSSFRQLNVYEDDFIESDLLRDSATDVSSETNADANADNETTSDQLEDIWSLDQLNDGGDLKLALRSWENYQDPSFREPISAYFSESGARGFDAALVHRAVGRGSQSSGRIARNGTFFQALLQLGLGWSSLFFRFNGQKGVFERVLDDVRVSGVSLPAINSLIEEMLQYGTNMRRVRTFVNDNPARSNGLSALTTFSGAAAAIIYTLEKHIARSSGHAVSLLQIKALFQRPGELIGALANILSAAQLAATDAEVISTVFGKVAYLCQKFAWMESVLYEVAVCVAKPWLKFVEAWVGLCPETPMLIDQVTNGRSFVALEYLEDRGRMKLEPARADYSYCAKQMPSFIPAGQAELIFEAGKSLRLLKRSHPHHPIANTTALRHAEPPGLHCTATWTDIERIQDRAHAYEAKLRDEILKYNLGKIPGPASQREAKTDIEEEIGDKTIAHTFELFDLEDKSLATGLLATPFSMEKGKLSQLLDASEIQGSKLVVSNFGPELASTLYLSLAPVIASQALLIDFSCLHLLFKEHRISYHLALQWRFQLLGDGYFMSRLSHALFDPEMRSVERKSGRVRTSVHTGLRLGSRDTWPPASSELRLVLIGLLNECYFADYGSGDSESVQLDKERELPGGLSFAIRALSEEEIAKCKDPNAVEALDFLRLQYKPPAVLEAIITRRSLDKYDRLFKHLLRLTRMVSVVNGLVRDSTARDSLSGDTHNVFQKFRIDSQRFILAFSDYCFHIGVGSNWRRLQDTLSRIEHCLDRGDIDGTIEAAHSIPWLRNYHEDTLDQMLFALFLSKRHAQAAALLENLFRTILTFAPLSRMDGINGVRHESEKTVSQLYAVFRKRSSAFVGYLRSLDPGKASSKSLSRSGVAFTPSMDSTSVFEHLLARLDMKEYF